METPPPDPQRRMFDTPERDNGGGSFKFGLMATIACVIVGLLLHAGPMVALVLFGSPLFGVILALLPSSRKFGLGLLLGGLISWMLAIPMCMQGINGIN